MERKNSPRKTMRAMQIGALVFAVLLILPDLWLAFLYPTESIAVYLRFAGIALFLGVVAYSVYMESKGKRPIPKSHEEKVAERMAREENAKAANEQEGAHRKP